MFASKPAAEILCRHLHKSFGSKRVLEGVDLRVDCGELVAIVGGSGSGKTVLLKHITGHFKPDSGQVFVADHESAPDESGDAPLVNVGQMDDDSLDRLRRHWAVVFQRNALLSGTVFRNLALLPREMSQMSDHDIMPLARKALHDVGLEPDQVLQSQREDLSGGMAKRVAIARALVVDPVLVMYDEPTAGLDPEMCAQIHDLIRSTHERQPQYARTRAGTRRTSVVVTHDTGLLQRLQPRIVMLNEGRVNFDGSFADFMASDDRHILPYLTQMPNLHMRNPDAVASG